MVRHETAAKTQQHMLLVSNAIPAANRVYAAVGREVVMLEGVFGFLPTNIVEMILRFQFLSLNGLPRLCDARLVVLVVGRQGDAVDQA